MDQQIRCCGNCHSPSVEIITGDFDGDGGIDIALVNRYDGWRSASVAFSTEYGDQVVTNQAANDFAVWARTAGVKIISGNFDGNSETHIALVNIII